MRSPPRDSPLHRLRLSLRLRLHSPSTSTSTPTSHPHDHPHNCTFHRQGIAGRGVSLPASVNNASAAFARRAEARTKPGSGVGVTGFAAEKGLEGGFATGRSVAAAADPRGEAAMGERLADVMLLLRDFFNKR